MTLALYSSGKLKAAKRHKYGVAPKEQRTVGGLVFASKKEAEFYKKLMLLKRGGKVKSIRLQPVFVMKQIDTSYVADFRVTWDDGTETVYDVKGFCTPVYRLKRKCMAHFYPDVKIEEA